MISFELRCSIIQNELTATKWPHPYDSVGALRNRTTEQWDGKSSTELQTAMVETNLLEEYKESRIKSDASVIATLAGEGVGEMDSVEGVYEMTLRMEEEAVDTIDRLRTTFH